MPGPTTSLFWILVCVVLAPLLAGLVPRRRVPEVVLLLVLGVLIGPNVLALAGTDDAIAMLRQLGLGMLFLLAGYEIEVARAHRPRWPPGDVDVARVPGHRARRDRGLLGLTGTIHAEVAVAIALTSTALGTLLPILKDGGLLGTRLGGTVLHHGAYGELGPIVAMALLLGTRGPVASLLVLVGFALLAVLVQPVLRRGSSGGPRGCCRSSGPGPRPPRRRPCG